MGDDTATAEMMTGNEARIGPCAADDGAVTFPGLPDTLTVSDRSTTFQEIYRLYAPDVYRFALWLSGSADTAKDITSETFVRAWTSAAEPRQETVKAYLLTIARNLHTKQWRRSSRLEELDEMLPDPGQQPDETAANRDDFQNALTALNELPAMDRTVLLLRAEQGLAYEEIAAITGLSTTAAKVKAFRARAKLAALLKTQT